MALATTGLGGLGIVQRVGAGVALDPDASAFIAAVEAADGQALEPAIRAAYNQFVIGCKADASPFAGVSNFDAIKASCIMAGARTLAGALVPWRGPAPTNLGFVAGDYNRVTGLKGDGVGKHLNSNRISSSDPANNWHVSFFVTEATTSGAISSTFGYATYFGDVSGSGSGLRALYRQPSNSTNLGYRPGNTPIEYNAAGAGNATGLIALARTATVSHLIRVNQVTSTVGSASQPLQNAPTGIYKILSGPGANNSHNNGRLSFYSIGESVDLAALDARVTTLMAAIAAALT